MVWRIAGVSRAGLYSSRQWAGAADKNRRNDVAASTLPDVFLIKISDKKLKTIWTTC